MTKEILVSYNVVTKMAGHQPNKDVPILDAAKDIFRRVKENAMQCAVKGSFIEFKTVDDLVTQLKNAVKSGFSICCYDEDIGG